MLECVTKNELLELSKRVERERENGNKNIWKELEDECMKVLKRKNIEEDNKINKNEEMKMNNKEIEGMEVRKKKKSNQLANEWRQKGNQSLKNGDLKTAFDEYTKSILFAESKGTEIANGFANRSVVLFDLKDFKGCLIEIERAEKWNYSENLLYKLYNRKGLCYKYCNNKKEALKWLDLALKNCDKFDKEILNVKSWKEQIQTNIKGIEKIQKLNYPQKDSSILPSIGMENDIQIISQNDSKGRCLIAKNKISKGKILLIDEPFSGVLDPIFYLTNCHYCMKKLTQPIPCPNCCDVLYCDEKCLEISWDSYHSRECDQNFLKNVDMNSLLAYRMLMRGKQSQYKEQYSIINSLETHFDQRTSDQLVLFYLVSCYFVSTFGNQINLVPENISQFVFHLCHISSNSFFVQEILETDLTQKNIGIAIYPVASLINHSCRPNSLIAFDGFYATLRSSMEILQKCEVSISYGPLETRSEKMIRIKELKEKYFFNCNCIACQGENQKSSTTSIIFKCPNCNVPIKENHSTLCFNCQFQLNIKELYMKYERSSELFQESQEHFDSNELEQTLSKALECVKIRESIFPFESYHLGIAYDLLAEIYAFQGSYPKAVHYLEKSLKIVQHFFGEESIEMGQELFKLSQLLFNQNKRDQAKKSINKCLKILLNFYGQENKMIQELQQMSLVLQ